MAEPMDLPIGAALNLYEFMIREHADDKRMAKIDAALEPPNRIDAATGAPVWWSSDDDAWAEFAAQL